MNDELLRILAERSLLSVRQHEEGKVGEANYLFVEVGAVYRFYHYFEEGRWVEGLLWLQKFLRSDFLSEVKLLYKPRRRRQVRIHFRSRYYFLLLTS